MADYHKVGLVVLRDNRILLCRKKHTTALLILPGGRFEPGETALACLDRELKEELGEVHAENVEFLGTYTDRAAGGETGPPKTVQIELYRGDLIGDPSPNSEIAQLIWFAEHDDRNAIAPSIRNKILPDLIARQILPWRH